MKRVRLWLRLARLAVVLLLGLALASFVAVVERAYRHDLMALRQRLTAWFLGRLSRALPFDVEVRGELHDSMLAHSYFVESVSVIKDIASMFRMRLAAAQRASLRAIKTRFGQYWRIEPSAR